MATEAVLLTGGASRRMGVDKAKLIVHGKPMALHVAGELGRFCHPVTILGREPLAGYQFLADEGEYRGPLFALSRFEPELDLVFVASCDLPFFDGQMVEFLATRIGAHQAAIPELGDRLQPLCALYRSECFALAAQLVAEGESRIMRWVDKLIRATIAEDDLPARDWMRNFNTPRNWPGTIRSGE